MPNRLVSGLFVLGAFFSMFFGSYSFVSAQTSSTTIPINAEILSNVWYSTNIINEKDTINIYVGFQNHSDKNLSGTAGFYVDDLEINKVKFDSNPKSLIKLETPYTAVSGNHSVQVRITEIHSNSDASISVNNLEALESEKKGLNVKYQITTEVVLDKASDIASIVVNNIDKYASTLADTVEGLKTPVENTTKSQISSQTTKPGAVLGTSTNAVTSPKNVSGFSFYNLFLDVLAFLLRHWIWTFVALIFLVLFFIFKKG